MTMVRSPRSVRHLKILLLSLLLLSPIVLLLAPWRQTVRASGRVVAFAPLDRRQIIEAPIPGRVVRWWVQEGSQVEQDMPLFEIADIDPQRVERLESQLEALNSKLDALESQEQQYRLSVDNIRGVGDLNVAVARAQLEEAQERVTASAASVRGAEAELVAAELQVLRKRELIASDAVSRRELELAEADFAVAVSKVEEASAKLDAASADMKSLSNAVERASVDAQARVNAAIGTLEETRSKTADTRRSILELQGQISRQQSQLVTSPRPGIVHRLIGNQGGEVVSVGEPLLELVPDTLDRAVEVWVDGNDAPLVAEGDEARLQFEGWPAVQFSGWPSVAVGTFGGRVALVDPTDDGQGRFRILITPSDDQQWPDARYLRQGVRANAWVLLNEVTIGWELWRQLNGFPPVVAQDEAEAVARKRLK
jgi:multidrug efflux pump subunit AcrA (membrane-fusion protein)